MTERQPDEQEPAAEGTAVEQEERPEDLDVPDELKQGVKGGPEIDN